MSWEFGIDVHHCCLEWITNEGIYRISSKYSALYYVMTEMGEESEKRIDACICITESLSFTPEIKTLLINCTPI